MAAVDMTAVEAARVWQRLNSSAKGESMCWALLGVDGDNKSQPRVAVRAMGDTPLSDLYTWLSDDDVQFVLLKVRDVRR